MTGRPTYWMLDELTGWRTGSVQNVQADGRLTLAVAGAGYATSGTWTSAALDGDVPGCQWHRIELELADLPAGSAVALATFAADDPAAAGALPADAWSPLPRIVGAVPRPGAGARQPEDLLIQSPPGRWLWIQIQLTGDGGQTPAVTRLVAHYPRDSYLRYLPAVYGASDAARSFLERFLSIPQTEWDRLRERIATIARYFDPYAVPDDGLAYLASWLDAELEPGWTADDGRRLLALLPSLRDRRGTAGAVRATARVYLRSIAGETADHFPYPYLIEGFRERDWLTLGAPAEGRLPRRRLWSADVVRRLQVGTTAQTGRSRLVSVGDPVTDAFTVYAHRVRALAPAGWVRTATQQRRLERGLRVELPAHVAARVTLLEPYFQAGAQATLGVDTVAGPVPRMRLAGTAAEPADRAPAPARRPRGCLGYDTVLARPPRRATGPTNAQKGDRS